MTTLQIVHTMNGGSRQRKRHKVLALVNSVAIMFALFSTYCFVFQPVTLLPNLQQTKKQNPFDTLNSWREDNDSNTAESNIVDHKTKAEDESIDFIMDDDDDDDDFLGDSTTGGRTLSFWKSLTNVAFGKVEQGNQKTRALRKRSAVPP